MNLKLLDLLICPACKRQPELECFATASDAESCSGQDREIISGVLKCGCASLYPITDGVPRFLEGGVGKFPEFVSEFAAHLEGIGYKDGSQPGGSRPNEGEDYENIRKSFSQEWGIFDYDGDKTWGWTLDQRKSVFLSDVAMEPAQLTEKLLLDAGCGNGTMTAALSDFCHRVVGLDLNDGLGRAFKNRGKYGENAISRVQYVQGNLVSSPLRRDAFDLIYSSGVIHHTPSSKHTFESLVPLVKSGGRLYVWVYGKRGWPVRLFFWWGRSLKNWMSLRGVMTVCRMLAPVYRLAAKVLSSTGLIRFRSRTSTEITLDLFDAFAPRYNHWHTEAEVRSWFEQNGFKNIQMSGVQKHGFGMYGDRI
jgi:SAM-dependent methyltransferase/uncharacterized protein YbaR (Trm112 family)